MADDNAPKSPAPNRPRLKRLSLYPLKPERALAPFMRVDPEKVKEADSRALPKA